MKAEATTPLVSNANPPQWGDIEAVVNAPLIGVPPDASWISVLGMWLLLPINLIQGIIAGLIQCAFVGVSIGTCCVPFSQQFCSAYGSVTKGRPLWMAWTWWRYVLSGLVALARNGFSRLALFMWEWRAFGSARYWWHGEGVWCWEYKDVEAILKSQQVRKEAFGCVQACIPDLFPKTLMLFLSNNGEDSQWAALRKALHFYFLDNASASYKQRLAKLPGIIENEWPQPKLTELSDAALLQKLVAKSVFYMMFGVWVDTGDAEKLRGWRTNATFFILPRLVQRFIFNYGINKVKALRVDTVRILEKHGQQPEFIKMNNSLPDRWKYNYPVQLCDDMMYAIGFAGIGGTSACVESVGAFLQTKIPAESAKDAIKFGQFDSTAKMVARYKEDGDSYIREVCRLDPPVTSATAVLKEVTELSLAGREFTFTPGLLNQYTLSMANRDPSVFEQPDTFIPDRVHLTRAVTWNGAFGAADENEFLRICPGRYLSLDITKTIINHAVGHAPASQPGPWDCCA